MTAVNSKGTPKAKGKPRGKPFAKGQSGNPGGRPPIPVEVREAARALTTLALDTLKQVCETSDNDSARVTAANAILDRAWGKPVQQVAGTDGEGNAVPLHIAQLPDGELFARAAIIVTTKGT